MTDPPRAQRSVSLSFTSHCLWNENFRDKIHHRWTFWGIKVCWAGCWRKPYQVLFKWTRKANHFRTTQKRSGNMSDCRFRSGPCKRIGLLMSGRGMTNLLQWVLKKSSSILRTRWQNHGIILWQSMSFTCLTKPGTKVNCFQFWRRVHLRGRVPWEDRRAAPSCSVCPRLPPHTPLKLASRSRSFL